jgi:Metallo-peptidase family M12B Reprolysin-like
VRLRPFVVNECRHHRRLPPARELLLAFSIAALVAVVAWRALPVAASWSPRGWDDGVVRIYDASELGRTVTTAAQRWNTSGADVRLIKVADRKNADVVFEVDDPELRRTCGFDCLGYTTSIGRPSDDRQVKVLLASELSGSPRPLSVWVAAHELGHVLGLHHRDGRACSLMSPRAFDTSCAPSLTAEPPTLDQLACVPAPADVEDATAIYGGALTRRDVRCR